MENKKIIAIVVAVVSLVVLGFIIFGIVMNSSWDKTGDTINDLWGETAE